MAGKLTLKAFANSSPGLRVKVDLPSGMSTWQRNRGDTMTIQIGAEGLSSCRTDEFARPDGSISGQVVDDAGVGLPGFVNIKPVDPKEAEAASRRGGLPGYETEDGNFELPLLPPGRYRLFFYPKIDGKVRLDVLAGSSQNLRVRFRPAHREVWLQGADHPR